MIAAIVTYLLYINTNRVILVSRYENYHENNIDNNTEKYRLKLLTYNIHHGVGVDGKLDLDRIAKVIKHSGADIIGLNEVDFVMRRTGFKNQISYLAKKLDMNYAFGASQKRITGSYGNAILSKYPINDVENYKLPSLDNINSETRSLLKVEIEISDNKNEKNIYIMSTHLSLNKGERLKQIRWIDDMVNNISFPYIIMGDFNTGIEEVVYTVGANENSKFVPLLKGIKTFPSINPGKEIDLYFSAAPIEVIKGFSIDSNASDHLPLYLELDIYI